MSPPPPPVGAPPVAPPVPPPVAPSIVVPPLVVHADWGSNPKKRWVCVAEPQGDGSYHVSAPEPVGEATTLLHRLTHRRGEGPVLVGFDFPIGLPAAYARRAGIEGFRDVLSALGEGRWDRFYDVAESADQIGPTRPFYPMRPGGTRQAHLTEALGVDSMIDLLRACERRNGTRGAASSLFWTLGGKQVGKAAIIGWRDVLTPALRSPHVDLALWPFDGSLHDLLASGGIVVAETYPAEACLHLGLEPPGPRWSKRRQEGRRAQGDRLKAWADGRPVVLDLELSALVEDGFGPSKDGEDPFDALLGLLSMLEVVLGHRGEGAPDEDPVRRVEGWILGQGG